MKVWIADANAEKMISKVKWQGEEYDIPSVVFVNDAELREPADAYLRWTLAGSLLGLLLGFFVNWLIGHFIRQKGEASFGDRTIGGTQIVSEKALVDLASEEASLQSLEIGKVPVPDRCETRHFAMIGTTGSGKTTVLRQMLDRIEKRGDAALVYDTSGEFIAHYYNPARGDIILNPFDARCAYWSPFDEISHPADADRIAHQLVSETGSYDDDVWLETSRILVANMLRALWREGNCSLEALFDALQVKSKEELKHWLGHTSSARTFADDADRATGSVLFMLAKAANLIQFLRADNTGGTPFAFRNFIHNLDKHTGPKPWIFVPRKEDYFEAAKPLMACWLECAASAVLGLSPSPDRRIWFILDELADLPKVENLARLLPEGRKFGAAIMLTFQALGQMQHRYGPNIAESMLACCNTKLFLQTVDQETRVWASNTIGECEIEMRTTTDMLSLSGEKPRTSLTTTRHLRPAVLESELRLGKYQGYLLLPDGYPVAKIALTNSHIITRGDPNQRPFVAGEVVQTLWNRTSEADDNQPPLPAGMV
ncbi:type IV secretion system DNA-binding domain-containing protein [Parasphingorhabdus sp.]|uniref:type IV secretion system DNA-binding domain-containing protein n=1 Tax=Parasphingorhabdus sp. TaxID=2709688 RepID=UPI003BAECCC4